MLYEEKINHGATRAGVAHEAKSRRSQMNRRVWALSQKLDQLVQRKGYDILQAELPRRMDRYIPLTYSRYIPLHTVTSCRRSCRGGWTVTYR